MKAIIMSEWQRFKGLALSVAGLHILLLLLLHNISRLVDGITSFYYISLIAGCLFALLLSWTQWRSMTQKNRWAFYIHRPISRQKMFAALVCSAMLLFLVASLIPNIVGLFFIDLYVGGLLDARLYLNAPYIFGLMLAIWLALGFTVLSPSKTAVLIFGFVALLLNPDVHGYWIFVTLLVVMACLYIVCMSAFKPALESHIRRPLSLALIAAAVQYSSFIMISFVLTGVIQIGLIVFDKEHTGNWDAYWQKGGVNYAQRMTDEALFQYGLEHSGQSQPQKTSTVEYGSLEQQWLKSVLRHQLFFVEQPQRNIGKIRDKNARVNWYFSHDEMLFFGIRERDAHLVGWMDRSGKTYADKTQIAAENRFEQIANTLDGDEFYHKNLGYRLHQGKVERFVEIASGEQFVSSVNALGDFYGALSDSHFYLFESYQSRLNMLAKLPLNTPINNLSRLSTAQLGNEIFVSVLSGADSESNYFDAKHEFYRINVTTKKVEHLSALPLKQDWSDLYRYRGFIVSPLMQYLREVLNNSLQPCQRPTLTNGAILTQLIPSGVVVWMLLNSLFCMAAAVLIGRKSQLTSKCKSLWIVVCGFSGVPGLLSFVTLNHFNDSGPPD